MKKAENILWQIIDWFLFLGTSAMVVLIFINVIGRYVFSFTFVSFEEIARILFVWCTYLGSAVAMKESTHIRVDIIINLLPPVVRRVVDVLANLLISFILILTIRAMMNLVIMNIANPLPLTRIPYGVVQGIIPAAMAVMLVVNVIHLIQMFQKKPERKEEPAS